ncbi:Lsr2 family DNA-binding protein [Streptomyces sp. C10-9-1]|uniref:Lsr2 family DNA-binding protein n=1 Tax=Streptomyces sp. C10-9-1 TaxID=1859285 RepID=UPI003F4A0C8D
MTIRALLALLDSELPHVVRPAAPWIPHTAHKRTDPPTVTIDPGPTAPASPPVGPPSTETLLTWAARHVDPKLQRLGAETRTALDTLRTRHAADAELSAIAKEKEQLEARLTQLRAREGELTPRPTSRSKTRDHDPRVVRAWARAAGHTVPDLGRVPKAIVDAWREAGEPR